ncbi:MAG TPA: tetratricopeptide repeat protein [Candidatus Obscuribacter sp.]|nr:tetratricopeptide repeat protein [Candidatus Obscuribacter sp.]
MRPRFLCRKPVPNETRKLRHAENRLKGLTAVTLTLALALSFAGAPALAGPMEGLSGFSRGNSLIDSGNYLSAKAAFETAISDFSQPGFEKQQARCINGLGIALWRMGFYKEAEGNFRKALDMTGQYEGKTCQEYAATLNNLALMLQLQGNFPEAETLFRQSLAICDATGGRNRADFLSNLAGLFQDQGKYADAEEYYKQALALSKSSGDQVQEAITLNDIGTLYRDMDRYTEAEHVLKRACDILKAQYGANHSFSAAALANLAQVYSRQGRYSEALPMMKEALAAKEAAVGPTHPMVATSLVSLAELNLDQMKSQTAAQNESKAREVENLLNRALTIRQEKLGQNNPDTAQVLELLGTLRAKQKSFTEAEDAFRQAISIRETCLGADNVLTAKCRLALADSLTGQNRFSDAETLLKQNLEIDKRSVGQDSPRTALDLDKLAALYTLMNKPDQAAAMKEQALSIKTRLPGGARLKQTNQLLTSQINTGSQVTSMPLTVNGLATSKPPASPLTVNGLATPKPPASPLTVNGSATPNNLPQGTKPGTGATFNPQVANSIGQKYALVIGISNFEDPSLNLKYSAKDARDFCSYLTGPGNFKQENTRLLIDKEASLENIVDLIGDSWLPRVVKPDDLVVIYFSGHGSPAEMDVKGDNYLVVYNTKPNHLFATGLSMTKLLPMIKERVKTERVLLVFDACHSGAAREGAKGLYRADNFDSQALAQGTGQMVICSSAPDQVSWESKQYPNGVFTRQLIDILAADGGTTPLSKIFLQLKDNVQAEVLRDRGRVQTPEFKSAWNGNDLKLNIVTK